MKISHTTYHKLKDYASSSTFRKLVLQELLLKNFVFITYSIFPLRGFVYSLLGFVLKIMRNNYKWRKWNISHKNEISIFKVFPTTVLIFTYPLLEI